MMKSSFSVCPPRVQHLRGNLSADGVHVHLFNTDVPASIVRVAKYNTLELWGITPHRRHDPNDARGTIAPNLFWLVNVHQHNNQIVGHIVHVALIYPGDHAVLRRFIQPLRAEKLEARAIGETLTHADPKTVAHTSPTWSTKTGL